MYKSSTHAFFFKNIFPVLFLGGGIIAFIVIKSIGEEDTSNFANALGLILIWNSVFIIQMAFRLRNVDADENGLKINSSKEIEFIPFKNITTIGRHDLACPYMTTIKFTDSRTNELRTIAYMPKQVKRSSHELFKLDQMAEYIQGQAKASNPDFVESNAKKNFLKLFLIGLPLFIVVGYYMFQFMTTIPF